MAIVSTNSLVQALSNGKNMAHFAELDQNNIVLRVIVVANEALEYKEFPDSESHAMEYLHQWFGSNTVWKQTSYNNRFRGNFAGIGMKYYTEYDLFMPSSPYPSWIINPTSANWESPVAKPDCKQYKWNEETVGWDYVPPKPQPFASWTLDACDEWQPPIPRPTDPLPERSIYVWREQDQMWAVLTLPDPATIPPMPTDPLPEGKIYAFDLNTLGWIVKDAPTSN